MGWQRKKIHQPISETLFSLNDKPMCSFEAHLDDVLDPSCSKSQQLLSSSRDKTVRLWDMECKICLKLFAHNDYVTCIQFNPVDDDYFISSRLTLRFAYGIYRIGKLYIGLICMKWSLLFATHMMARARYVAFADCRSSFTLSFMSSFICKNLALYNIDTCPLFYP